jgi:hypothetical protein
MSIEIPGDELIPDAELAKKWGCTQRTLTRYDNMTNGLPYVMLGGKKFRPAKACAEWLANQIKRPNPRRAA